MKLSDTQKEILKLMNDGWELGIHYGATYTWGCLQKGGLGYGGEVKKIKLSSIFSLKKSGHIAELEKQPSWNTKAFKLTELGESIK